MGISLNNTTPAVTYPALIKFGDNFGVTATLKNLSDGDGNDLPIQVKNNQVNIVGTLTQNGLPVTTPPSGVAGAIQFSNGSAFASDAANLFWDDTNNRLGVGTNAPTSKLQVTESFTTTGNNYSAITFDGTLTSRATANDTIYGFRNTQTIVATATGQTIIANDLTPNYTFFDANTNYVGLKVGGSANTQNNGSAIWCVQKTTAGNNGLAINPYNSRWGIGMTSGTTNIISGCDLIIGQGGIGVGISGGNPDARLEINGSGSTSATTSLLVQNSGGTQALKVADDGVVTTSTLLINNTLSFNSADYGSLGLFAAGVWNFNGGGINNTPRINWGGYTSSFPSLKRNGTAIDVRLADDSNYAGFNTGATTIKGSGSTSATTSLLVQNSSGTAILTVRDGGADKQVVMNSALIGSLDISGSIVQVGAGVNLIFRSANGVALNSDYSSANASAQLDVSSTTKGFLPPRMTTTQKNAISTPAAGLVVYDSTTNKLCCYNGSTWNDLF